MNSTVNIGHQTSLAKLLAKENVQVRTGNFRTAYFDVRNRVLGLPIMAGLDKAAYDLFVGHEVGHALFTPQDIHEKLPKDIPFDTINVIEDIRIERLIQDTYPGLSECFRQGYRQLWSQNFFQTSEASFPKLGRLDRLNIRAKLRGVIDFKLSPDEEAFYQKCYAANTVEDVLALCKEIYEAVKKDVESPKNNPEPKKEEAADDEGESMPSPKQEAGESTGSSGEVSAKDDSKEESSTDSDSPSASSSDSESESEDEAKSSKPADESAKEDDGKSDLKSSTSTSVTNSGVGNRDHTESPKSITEELKAKTADALNDALKSKVTFENGCHMIVEPSKKNLERITVPYSKVSAARRKNEKYAEFTNAPQFIQAKHEFNRKAKSHVSILTREFEMRRKAFQYSRSKESKSGSLNMERLHSYKYSEDIFRSVTVLANSKNHGMVMFIDFSDSMNPNISAVLEQTIYLALFCRAVSIPFAVYGFTSPGCTITSEELNDAYLDMTLDEVTLHGRIHLVEQLSSKMSKNEFLNAVNELYAIAYYSDHSTRELEEFPNYFSGRSAVTGIYDRLGSTPLLECVIAAHRIVSQFKKSNALQKCSVIFLTDGDGMRLNTCNNTSMIKDQSELRDSWSRYHSHMKIELNGKTVKFDSTQYRKQYSALIKNLRETTGASVIGFFICNRHAVKNYLQANVDNREVRDKMMSQIRKNSYAIANDGLIASYDAMFILPGITSSDEDFDVELDESDRNDAGFTSTRSVNKIANAFIDSAKDKKRSRIILQSFAEIIS